MIIDVWNHSFIVIILILIDLAAVFMLVDGHASGKLTFIGELSLVFVVVVSSIMMVRHYLALKRINDRIRDKLSRKFFHDNDEQ